MINYIYEFTNNIFQTVNYLIIVSYNKIYDSFTNYFIHQYNNISNPKSNYNQYPKPSNIEFKENKKKYYLKIIKSYSYNILPNNINKSVILDVNEIYEDVDVDVDVDSVDNFEIYKFDYTIKYLSTDKLYGWYIDIEEKEKFI